MKKISDILCGFGVVMCTVCTIAAAINTIASPWLIIGSCGSLAVIGAGYSIRKAIREERDRLD